MLKTSDLGLCVVLLAMAASFIAASAADGSMFPLHSLGAHRAGEAVFVELLAVGGSLYVGLCLVAPTTVSVAASGLRSISGGILILGIVMGQLVSGSLLLRYLLSDDWPRLGLPTLTSGFTATIFALAMFDRMVTRDTDPKK